MASVFPPDFTRQKYTPVGKSLEFNVVLCIPAGAARTILVTISLPKISTIPIETALSFCNL
jgi:hypothetical protein